MNVCKFCGEFFLPKQKQDQCYCSRKCFSESRKNRVVTKCDWCNKEFELKKSLFEKYQNHYCCKQHKGFANSVRNGAKIKQIKQELQQIYWSPEIAYLVGLIATDGTLRSNRKQIKIASSSRSFLEEISKVIIDFTGRTINIDHSTKYFNGKKYDCYAIAFTSYPFYDFCLTIGLTPAKTYSLSKLKIPDEYFHDFLRGVIDGDGNYNSHALSEIYKVASIRIYSGSIEFLRWINETCKRIYKIQGGNFTEDSNELGRKDILIFSRVYDNLLIIERIYLNAKIFYKRRYQQVMYTHENVEELKEKYRNTYLIDREMTCFNPYCNNTFRPSNSIQKFCSNKCNQFFQNHKRKLL